MPVILGHQVVGRVDKLAPNVTAFIPNDRVGVPWLYKTCGTCPWCTSGRENLCNQPLFTGYDVDGGYAEYMVVHQDYACALPDNYSDSEAAPLLCAGVIGYEALQATGLRNHGKLGLFGFGSSAHIITQVAVHLGLQVYVVSRTEGELNLAKECGAYWTGQITDDMGVLLDGAIVFAPTGELLVQALSRVDKGSRVVSAGIYATPLPGFNYSLIYPEKCLTSIAHTTRQHVKAFLKLASGFKIKTTVNEYVLEDVNRALLNIKESKISGSTVLRIE
jgi:propanol-preferring alcohol dehydrogenase